MSRKEIKMKVLTMQNGYVYANLRGSTLEDAIAEVEKLTPFPAKIRMRTKQEVYEKYYFGTSYTNIRESYNGKLISVIGKDDRYISIAWNSLVRECTSNWKCIEKLLESLYVLRYYLRYIEGFR